MRTVVSTATRTGLSTGLGCLLVLLSAGCVGNLGSIETGSESANEGGACPCESDEVCTLGTCTAAPYPAPCDPVSVVDTVCSSREVCLDVADVEEPEMTVCYEMPPCPIDAPCPTGVTGSVCNEELWPGKERVCLLGRCTNDTHCPEQSVCVNTGTVLGSCSTGLPGDLCTADMHCDSGNCVVLVPGVSGFCG